MNSDVDKKKFRYSWTVFLLPSLLVYLFIMALQPFDDLVHATRRALGFAMFISALIGCLFLPDGFIIRPSQYLWKAVTGLSFFYLAILTYFLYLDKQNSVAILNTYIDPSLKSINYEEASYAEDCRLYKRDSEQPFENILGIFDIFAFAHIAGWFFKTLVCRDFKILMFSSLVFELIQFSLRDVLNNFKECWWDHVIVDFLGCNMIGIVCGFLFIDYFKLTRYKWSLRVAPMQNSLYKNVSYFWTHWDLSELETKAFSSTKKYLQLSYFLLFMQMVDISLFFFKFVYGIPPSNIIVVGRIVLIGFLCINASREYFQFIKQNEPQIRINCFLANLIIFLEFFLAYRHGSKTIDSNATDFDQAYFTTAAIVILISLLSLFLIVLIKILISDLLGLVETMRPRPKIQATEPEALIEAKMK